MTYVESVQVNVYTSNKEFHKEVKCYKHETTGNSLGGRVNEFCKDLKRMYKGACEDTVPMWITTEDAGQWLILGPYGLGWLQEVEVVGRPRISEIGPVVVSRQLRRKLIITPEYSLKHIKIELEVEVHKINHRCEL